MRALLGRLSLSDPGLFLGRLAGVPLRVQPAALLVGLGFSFALAGQFTTGMPAGAPRFAPLAMGASAYLGMVASLLAHEFGHVLVARRFGAPCKVVVLTPFGMAADIGEFPRPLAEGAVALAGPAVSLVLALAAWLAWGHLDGLAALLARSLFYLNAVIAVFNMIPNYPMDGGRVVRALAWAWTGSIARGTRIAARIGWGGAVLVAGIGVLQVAYGNPFGALTLMAALLMLAYAAREVRERHTAAAPPPPDARALMTPFGIRPDEPGVTLCPLSLLGRLEAAVVFWDGERKVGHARADAIVRVPPEADLAQLREAIGRRPSDGWPIILVCDTRPLGFIPVGRIMVETA